MDQKTSQTHNPNLEMEKSTPSKWLWILIWVALAGLLLILALGLRRSTDGPITIGDEVPDFTLTTFQQEQVRLSDFRGQVVLLNFWASWCKPCEQEAADLQTAWEMYAPTGKVIFLGVDYVDTEPEAMAYLNKYGITYLNGPDLRTKISQAFRIRGVPETYIINGDGVLVDVKIGPFTSLGEIQQSVEKGFAP